MSKKQLLRRHRPRRIDDDLLAGFVRRGDKGRNVVKERRFQHASFVAMAPEVALERL